jgi:hypothetical protein
LDEIVVHREFLVIRRIDQRWHCDFGIIAAETKSLASFVVIFRVNQIS